MERCRTDTVSRWLLNNHCLRGHRLDMGTKTHSNIMHFCGTDVKGNWRSTCRYLVVIFEIKVAAKVSHHLTLWASTRCGCRTSLPEGCQLPKFLDEWLWDWTEGCIGNSSIKWRLIHTYIELRIALIECHKGKRRTPIAKTIVQSQKQASFRAWQMTKIIPGEN